MTWLLLLSYLSLGVLAIWVVLALEDTRHHINAGDDEPLDAAELAMAEDGFSNPRRWQPTQGKAGAA